MKDNHPIITMRVPSEEKSKAKSMAEKSNVSLCRYAAQALMVRNRIETKTFQKIIADPRRYNKILSD